MKLEQKFGLLFLGSLFCLLGLGWALGFFSGMGSGKVLHVMYNYAGGLEEGSPVRVMGIRVGRVKNIQFVPGFKMPSGEVVQLRVSIQIEPRVWESVRRDSQFFINLAGVIGEKFLEISPGDPAAEPFESGSIVRGQDPPRVDQLISQSYGLAGKVIELLQKNEAPISSTIARLELLVSQFNRTLTLLDKASHNPEVSRLLKNAVQISDDLAYLTGQARSQKSRDTFELVHRLLFRLENLDGPAIRQFLQKEGIKAKIF